MYTTTRKTRDSTNRIYGDLHQAACRCYNKFNDSKVINSDKTKFNLRTNETQVEKIKIVLEFLNISVIKLLDHYITDF